MTTPKRFAVPLLALAGLLSVTVVEGCSSSGRGSSDAARAVDLPPSIADPAFLEQYAATYRFGAGTPRSVRVTPEGEAVLFLRSGPRSVVQDLHEFDVRTGKERIWLTADQLLAGQEERLTAEELARRERMRMSSRGIAAYDLSEDGRKILVPLSGRLFVVDRADARVTEVKSENGYPIDPRLSPDGASLAAVRDGDLYIAPVAGGPERRLTAGATEQITHGLAEFVAQEEMGRFHGYWWSPDSRFIAYQRTDTTGLEVFHIADPMNPAKEADSWPYPRPGRQNAEVTLGIIPAEGGTTTWVNWDRARYPYLAHVSWSKNAPLTIVVQNRNQTEEVVYAVEPSSGSVTELLRETDPAWINLVDDMPRWVPSGNGFLWMTERSGEWRLELRDRQGRLVRELTPEGFGLRDVAGVDEPGGWVYVTASAEPTESHLWRVRLHDSPVGAAPPPDTERLTGEPGLHSAAFAEKFGAWVLFSSPLKGEITRTVIRADRSVAGELRSIAEPPPFEANVELITLGGPRHFRAAVVRPRNFAPGRRYPVIASVYAGPHAQVVNASRRGYLFQQWMADHGYIVVSFDGRGTPNRGREWERAIHRNLIDVPLEDQAEALRQLGARLPELDLSRVGVTGWSFGGYFSAMAAMRRPDVYACGVAGAPVCAWEDYDTHYTERYMMLPEQNPDGYEKSSVLTYCKDLKNPLLIIHGTSDDNVYFMHSLKMTDALFKAGKSYDFLALPGFTHMVPDPVVTRSLHTRIMNFFDTHLKRPG